MSRRFTSNVFDTTGAQRFLNTLENDLAHRKSLFVMLPASVDAQEVWERLDARLSQRFDVVEIAVNQLSNGRSIVSALAEGLRVKWPSLQTPRTVANMLSYDSLPQIIRLEGVEYLADGAKNEWMNLLRQWAHAAQNTKTTPPALCIVATATEMITHVPETNVRLSVRWWWGVLSPLELRMMCRLEGGEFNAINLWREHILSALSGDDVSLAEYLWEDVRLEADDIINRLRGFAEVRGWHAKLLREWGAGEMLSAGLRFNGDRAAPPKNALRLWGKGALHWSDEHGPELHTAALVILESREVLLHRLWRGQAALLLPLLNNVRLKLCDHLTRCHGNAWPVQWWLPESPEEAKAVSINPFACQWGHLRNLLRSCSELQHERRWSNLANLSHRIRNELAHYRPISFLEFELFWQELKRTNL